MSFFPDTIVIRIVIASKTFSGGTRLTVERRMGIIEWLKQDVSFIDVFSDNNI